MFPLSDILLYLYLCIRLNFLLPLWNLLPLPSSNNHLFHLSPYHLLYCSSVSDIFHSLHLLSACRRLQKGLRLSDEYLRVLSGYNHLNPVFHRKDKDFHMSLYHLLIYSHRIYTYWTLFVHWLPGLPADYQVLPSFPHFQQEPFLPHLPRLHNNPLNRNYTYHLLQMYIPHQLSS